MKRFHALTVEDEVRIQLGDNHIWRRKGMRSMNQQQRLGFHELLCVNDDWFLDQVVAKALAKSMANYMAEQAHD